MDWAGIDEWIYRRLTELVDVLPMRFVKLVAHNYTDARVRKLYWRRLGLEMGEGTYANLGLTLLSDDYTPRVHIGNHVSIAANVTFVPMASANNGQEINTYPYVRDHLTKAADIVVEDEVWIGADVTILPGVHIGDGAIIAARSVLTRDIPPYTIAGGNPAAVRRQRFDEALTALLLELRWWDFPPEVLAQALPMLCNPDLEAFTRWAQDLLRQRSTQKDSNR